MLLPAIVFISLMTDTGSISVASRSFDYAGASGQRVVFSFTKDANPSISSSNIILQNLDTGEILPSASYGVSYDSAARQAIVSFSNYASKSLPDGNYRITLLANAVKDLSGKSLAAPDSFDFCSYPADFNRDRWVDIRDLYVLSTNYMMSNKIYLDGDASYNGSIGPEDLGAISMRWSRQLPERP